jgi:hypothetical protein
MRLIDKKDFIQHSKGSFFLPGRKLTIVDVRRRVGLGLHALIGLFDKSCGLIDLTANANMVTNLMIIRPCQLRII